MSEATAAPPGGDNAWDTIDEAVREQLGQVLTAGTNLISGSELMGRLDPLALFQPLLRTSLSAATRPDKVVGVLTRAAGEMREIQCAGRDRQAPTHQDGSVPLGKAGNHLAREIQITS